MIYIIDANNRDEYGHYLIEMARLRYEIFVETRGWHELDSFFRLEFDEYDSRLATYLLCVDEGRVLGGVRVMPTIFGTLLGEKFGKYLYNPDYAFGPTVWEMYRLFVADHEWRAPQGHDVRREIMLSLIEFLAEKKADKVVAVSDSSLTAKLPPFWKWREIGERHAFEQSHSGLGQCSLVEIEIDAAMVAMSKKAFKFTGKFFQRAEQGLEPKSALIMPEEYFGVNKWLVENPEFVNTARAASAAAGEDPAALEQFKELVLRSTKSGLGVQARSETRDEYIVHRPREGTKLH